MAENVRKSLDVYVSHPHTMLVNSHNASVYHIGRYILGEVRDREMLPRPVEEVVDDCHARRESWFVRPFYYDAIACLVYVHALDLSEDDVLTAGDQYAEWGHRVDVYREHLNRSRTAEEMRTMVRAEGKRKAMEEFVPDSVRGALLSSVCELAGVNIDRRNFSTRVTPGARCYVELGKRHYRFHSEVTQKEESLSFGASFYTLADVVSIGGGNVRVKFPAGDEVEVDAWRISKIIT